MRRTRRRASRAFSPFRCSRTTARSTRSAVCARKRARSACRDRGWRLLDQTAVRDRFLAARRLRGVAMSGLRSQLVCGGPTEPIGASRRWEIGTPPDEMDDVSVRRERQFAALGFEPDDLKMASFMIETGNEPIGSLGYDGPLGALAPRANLADHLQETVAVVTNPAIDRERETQHFSTRALLGPL